MTQPPAMLKRLLLCLLLAVLTAAGAAVVTAILLTIADLYLAGHSIEPANWWALRDWIFLGAVLAVFGLTLAISWRARSRG